MRGPLHSLNPDSCSSTDSVYVHKAASDDFSCLPINNRSLIIFTLEEKSASTITSVRIKGITPVHLAVSTLYPKKVTFSLSVDGLFFFFCSHVASECVWWNPASLRELPKDLVRTALNKGPGRRSGAPLLCLHRPLFSSTVFCQNRQSFCKTPACDWRPACRCLMWKRGLFLLRLFHSLAFCLIWAPPPFHSE